MNEIMEIEVFDGLAVHQERGELPLPKLRKLRRDRIQSNCGLLFHAPSHSE